MRGTATIWPPGTVITSLILGKEVELHYRIFPPIKCIIVINKTFKTCSIRRGTEGLDNKYTYSQNFKLIYEKYGGGTLFCKS